MVKNLRFFNMLFCRLLSWPGSCSKPNCFKRPWSGLFLKCLCPLNIKECAESLFVCPLLLTWLRSLTLPDTGFFGLQKYMRGTFCSPPILIFALEQQWYSNVVSSFTSRSRVHKNIQNYESNQVSQLMTS